MPKFAKIKGVMSPKRPMTEIEILRAIKFAIASEFEAIQIYEQIMESTDNMTIKKVLAEITKDEKQHAGGLYRLLAVLSPGDEKDYAAGAQETDENMA